MKRRGGIWSRRTGLLVGSGLFFLGNLAFYVAYGSTTRTRETALERRRVELERRVLAIEAEAARLSRQRDRLAEVSATIEEFYGNRIGPRRETLAGVVKEVHDVLRRTGVTASQIGYGTKKVKGLALSQMEIVFGLHTDYARLKRLLHAFETNPRWIVVRDVALASNPEAPGEVQVHLVLGTYFSEERAAPPRPLAARVGA